MNKLSELNKMDIKDVIEYLFNAFEKRTFATYKTANFVSTNVDFHNTYQISQYNLSGSFQISLALDMSQKIFAIIKGFPC